jgi:hypothetical protein
MAGNHIVYVWRGTRPVAVISVEEVGFVDLMIELLPEQGYRVTVKKVQIRDVGPDD